MTVLLRGAGRGAWNFSPLEVVTGAGRTSLPRESLALLSSWLGAVLATVPPCVQPVLILPEATPPPLGQLSR